MIRVLIYPLKCPPSHSFLLRPSVMTPARFEPDHPLSYLTLLEIAT